VRQTLKHSPSDRVDYFALTYVTLELTEAEPKRGKHTITRQKDVTPNTKKEGESAAWQQDCGRGRGRDWIEAVAGAKAEASQTIATIQAWSQSALIEIEIFWQAAIEQQQQRVRKL